MLTIVLLLVPILPLLAYLSLRTPPGAPIKRISPSREVFSRLAIGLLFPGEWMLYRYLLPRQQTFLGMEWLRFTLYSIAAGIAIFFVLKAIRGHANDRTGSLILTAVAALGGTLAANLLYAWLCNLAFLLPGPLATRTFQLTSVRHDYGRGSSHSNILTGQMQDHSGPLTIKTYPFDGPDPSANLMTVDGHNFCDLYEAHPNDALIAQGRTNLFGFAIDSFEPANERLRSDCDHNASTYRP